MLSSGRLATYRVGIQPCRVIRKVMFAASLAFLGKMIVAYFPTYF